MKKYWVSALVLGVATTLAPAFAAEKKAPAKPAAPAQSAPAKPRNQGLVNVKQTGGYGLAGCGLGSLAFGEQEGLIQVIAATLNGTAGSQTFGISTGTSNCDAGMATAAAASVQTFIAANRETFEKDVARGNGETIVTVSQLLGCKDSAQVGKLLQGEYDTLFKAGSSPEQVGSQIVEKVSNDQALKHSCQVSA